MLDDGSDLGRRKKAHRTTAERAAIVAESYEPGAMVNYLYDLSGIASNHEQFITNKTVVASPEVRAQSATVRSKLEELHHG
jgi:hypothetical protein